MVNLKVISKVPFTSKQQAPAVPKNAKMATKFVLTVLNGIINLSNLMIILRQNIKIQSALYLRSYDNNGCKQCKQWNIWCFAASFNNKTPVTELVWYSCTKTIIHLSLGERGGYFPPPLFTSTSMYNRNI